MDLSFADAAIQIMCRLFCSYQNMQWHHMAQLYKPRVMQSSETTSANCAWSQDRPLIVHQSIELTMLAMAMQQRVIIPVGSSCCGELKALPANDPVYMDLATTCHATAKSNMQALRSWTTCTYCTTICFFYFSKTNASHTFTLYRNSRPSLGRLETAGCNAA